MNRDDIIRLALEAGFDIDIFSLKNRNCFERFAALVAEAEREECAKRCEEVALLPGAGPTYCAYSIRARGKP
jgi:hypothetical protein